MTGVALVAAVVATVCTGLSAQAARTRGDSGRVLLYGVLCGANAMAAVYWLAVSV